METHLTDRVTIVTGGGHGIGEGIALGLTAENCLPDFRRHQANLLEEAERAVEIKGG